jgi:DNA-binding GntR family transcriptional regulator
MTLHDELLESDGESAWPGLAEAITPTPALAEQVSQALYKAIVAGQIPENTRLSEAALAKAFGVSRTPVREALRQLAGEGLLRFEKGRGATVPAVSVKEVVDAYQVRMQLFGLAAGLAAQRITAAELEKLEESYDRMVQLAKKNEPDDYFWELVNFFSIVVPAARNSVLENWLQRQRHMARIAERVGVFSLHLPGTLEASLISFKALLEAIREGNAESAERIVRVVLMRTLEMTMPLLESENGLSGIEKLLPRKAARPGRSRRRATEPTH